MSDYIDPKQFIITRKRKKYKFAKFHNAENSFEFDDWKKRDVDVLEVGAGTGLFSVELAERHPTKTIVAIDVKADRLQKGAHLALERGIKNVFFVRARADQIGELVSAHSLSSIWLTFPDPFAKKRSAGRRLTHPRFLQQYAKLLSPQGKLYMKHDDTDFFHWSLEQLVAESWHIDELTFDLHDSDLNDDYKVLTSYEVRWLAEERKTNLVVAHKLL